MVKLITDVSKYLLIWLAAMYTFWSFRYFNVGDEKRERICRRRLPHLLFLLHFLACGVLFLNTGDWKLPVLYGVQAVFLLCYMSLYGRLYRNRSEILVNNMCMLLCVGFIILARLSFDKAVRQFVIIVFSAAVTMLVPFIMDHTWQLGKIPWLYGFLGLGLLCLVHVSGNTSYGAQLSLTVAGVSVQPSEFVKISFVFFTAAMFYRSTDRRQVFITSAVAALHVLLLVMSKDLGSGLIFFITYVFMIFAATSRWSYLGLGIFSGGLASAAAWTMFSHVRVRVMAWKNPWADIDNRGYQIAQSLFAIGTGGWFGLGLCQGMPGRIPVVEKDFVFAAVSEEMGALFAFCVLLICLGCFLQFMMIACEMQALFYKLIALGLGTMYIVQVFLTAGGATKFIPSTGVTLPLVSYGGSSVLSTFVLFSVMQGLHILKRNQEEEDEYETE